jgi:hypothetical protein
MAVSRWRKASRTSRFGKAPRAAIVAAGVGFALVAAPSGVSAQQAPAGMIPYDKPVFHNGHRVLWHGPGHAAGVHGGASTSAKAAAGVHDYSILIDPNEPSEARIAAELTAQAQANGVRLRAIAGKTTLPAIGKAVLGSSADLAIAPVDVLAAAGQKPPDWQDRAPYIARLVNQPVEIIAPRSISDVSQLAARKVNIEAAEGASAASATLLFSRLNIAPKLSNQPLADALGDLSDGRLDAVLVIGGRASKSLADFGRDGRFHVLSLAWSPALQGLYSPARLTSSDQPNLIRSNESVDTVSVGMALIALDAAPSSPRVEKLSPFVTQFLDHFSALASNGNMPGWKDVNLAASIDGWPRLASAQSWVEQNKAEAGHSLDSFKTLAQTAVGSNQGPSGSDSDRLYDSLMKWRAAQ